MTPLWQGKLPYFSFPSPPFPPPVIPATDLSEQASVQVIGWLFMLTSLSLLCVCLYVCVCVCVCVCVSQHRGIYHHSRPHTYLLGTCIELIPAISEHSLLLLVSADLPAERNIDWLEQCPTINPTDYGPILPSTVQQSHTHCTNSHLS